MHSFKNHNNYNFRNKLASKSKRQGRPSKGISVVSKKNAQNQLAIRFRQNSNKNSSTNWSIHDL